MMGKRAVTSLKTQKELRWTWVKYGIAIAIIVLASFLLYRTLSGYSLNDIVQSIKAIPPSRLLLAGLFAAGSYFCLSWFDWLALRYVEKPLPYRHAALASFCSLSLGHNIGFAALSSGAVRYRFYSRWGLRPGDIAWVIVFCGVTVGLGLITLAGLSLLLRPDLAAKITGIAPSLAIIIGLLCLAVSAVYLAAAAFVRRRLTIKGWSLPMPEFNLAFAQIAAGSANFACVAACLHQTLTAVADVPYFAVAAAYVIANGIALLTHVPGGLGVIESVMMLLLPGGKIIGALVMFRMIYFLVPLCIGGPLFAITELYYHGRKRAA
ncbi:MULTISPECIES: lysylphosphatidylglycerol synthase domain-containing protein [unclassified Tardiphaga]|uniref:lysylphosphatidylglycerol synthase domain-containing protein n=2 Tax=Tardiphaga TaxID=1395974 RepID=UPI001FEF5C10|nr:MULTISPECIES: lysylphosphatidylglycerol synthase domain-containing protein [unclassified Tardiphaga]